MMRFFCVQKKGLVMPMGEAQTGEAQAILLVGDVFCFNQKHLPPWRLDELRSLRRLR